MSLNSLRIRRDLVSLEAFSASDLMGLLKNTIPSMAAEFTSFVGRFTPGDVPVKLTSKQAAFMRELSKHTYLDVAQLAAYVPEGLDMTYLEYATQLEKATSHAARIVDDVMAPYSLFLSQLISNTDQKFSTSHNGHAFVALAAARTKINEALGDCFTPGSTRSETRIGSVVDRNSDWPQVFKTSEAVVKEINSVDRKVLNKKIAECAELLNIVTAKIKRNEFEGVSPQVIKHLAEGAFQVASELEFYSVAYFKATVYAEAVNRTIEHFQTVFETA